MKAPELARVRTARNRLDAARLEIGEAIGAAADAGRTSAEIGRAAKVSRQAIEKRLARREV